MILRCLVGSLAIIRHELVDLLAHPLPMVLRSLTLPVYVVALSALWNGLSPLAGVFPTLLYFVLTQTILDALMNRTSLDFLTQGFEAALLRPIPWMVQALAHLWARCVAHLLFIGLGGLVVLLALFPDRGSTWLLLRWALVIPVIALFDALVSIILITLSLKWGRAVHTRMVFTKALLALGGGLFPLLDPGPWTRLLLHLPFADLIFQMAYFVLTGDSFGPPGTTMLIAASWPLRVLVWMGVLALGAVLLVRSTRRNFLLQGGG